MKVYIISGTLGAGKTTVGRLLTKKLKNSQLVSSDIFMEMPPNNENLDWHKKLEVVWDNTISSAKSALALNKDVVIEGVIEDEYPRLQQAFVGHDIHYHILIANEDVLSLRMKERKTEELISRSMNVLNKFKKDSQKTPFFSIHPI